MADDWRKKFNESGYYFSDDDLKRAETDVNFRNQIYDAKEGYANAQAAGDTAGMDRWHNYAETARSRPTYDPVQTTLNAGTGLGSVMPTGGTEQFAGRDWTANPWNVNDVRDFSGLSQDDFDNLSVWQRTGLIDDFIRANGLPESNISVPGRGTTIPTGGGYADYSAKDIGNPYNPGNTVTGSQAVSGRPAYEQNPQYQKYIDDLLSGIVGYGDYDSPYAQQIRDALAQFTGYGPYQGKYDDRIAALLGDIEGYGDYVSPYATDIDTVLQGVLNRDPFSYDLESDPAWQAYKKQYTREGRRATEDTLGQMAAMTGGMPSTAAMTAASQAGDYYNAQMTDKIPELYRLAYDMYNTEGNRMLNNLSALRGLDSDAYGRYTDKYGRMLTDMSLLQGLDQTDYGRWSDQYNQYLQNLGVLQGMDQTEYGRWGDQFNRMLTGLDAARTVESDQYGRYRDSVGDWRDSRNFDYDAWRDSIGDSRYEQEYNDSRSDAERQRQWNEAMTAAEYGDYSLLAQLGITPDAAALLQMTLAGNGRTAPVGSGGGGGGNPTAQKPDLTVAQVNSAIKDGILTDKVLEAYEYYYGEPYDDGGDGEDGGAITDASGLGNRAAQVLQNAMNGGGRGNTALLGYVQQQINAGLVDGKITEDEASFILRQLGYGG